MTTNEIEDGQGLVVEVKMALKWNGRRRSVHVKSDEGRIVACDRYKSALRAFARAHEWRRLIDTGVYRGPDELAKAAGVDAGSVRKTLRLARLSPRIVRAFLEDNHPDDLTISRLQEIKTLSWDEQERIAGLTG